MVNKTILKKPRSFQLLVTLLFILLALGLEALIDFYWFRVLEPQLMAKAGITARALAQSSIDTLGEILALPEEEGENNVLKAMELAVDKVLLLTDPHTGSPFIRKIEIVMDYDAVNKPEGSLDMSRGRLDDDDFFVTEIPVYSQTSRELLGIARLYNSREVFRYFKKDVQSSFVAGAAIVIALLAIAWFIVVNLLERVRRSEEALREKQAQVVHAGRLTAMGEMATGIAHEINQPLAIIRVAADGLNTYFSDRKDLKNETREALKIVSQVERAASIIDNMRSFVRNGAEQADIIDLRVPIENALSFFREQFRIHRIRLNLNLPEDPVKIRVNPSKFQQIIVNLLSNARHAVEEKEVRSGSKDPKEISVHLTLEKQSDEVVLEISDNGIGMSREIQKRCMEPFYTTKDIGEGTGLGLSIALGIAREFKMALDVESIEGEGSLFRLRMKSA